MSVFKRPGATAYSYDFQFRNRRYAGSTSCTAKSDAQRFQDDLKRRLREAAADRRLNLTFEDAACRFLDEVGQFHADPSGTERNMAWLATAIGNETPVQDITNATVARIVALRRAEGVSPSTVNRSCVEPLRNLIRRAERVWDARVSKVDWRHHLLKEPRERVREASAEEEARLIALVPEDYRPLIRFAILTGCRRGEIVGLRWNDVNFPMREFRVTGKGDRSRTIPMTAGVLTILSGLRDHHRTAVFTYKAQRAREGKNRGKRYPITPDGLQSMWNRYVRGVVGDLRFHDTRHTAATRLVRATGNLKLAQKLLGHQDITTTSRYAHVTHEDLRAGLELVAAGR